MSAKQEVLNIIKYHQLDFRSEYWKESLFLIQENIYDEDYCQAILPEAREAAEQVDDSGIFLWKPPAEERLLGKPDIELGTAVETNLRVGIRFLDRPRNCLLTGGAGAGKTVCGLNLCTKIDSTNKYQKNPTSLIIIDIKPDYLALKKQLYLPTELYSPVHGLKIGLNCPDNVVLYLWITEISMTLAARLGLISSRTALTKIIAALLLLLNPELEKEDLYKPCISKDLIWPSLELVLKVTQNKKIIPSFSSKESYSLTLSHALEGLLQDAGTLFNCSNGLDINREVLGDQKKHCIFDVSNMASHVIHIITDIIICQIMMKRITENYKTDHTDVVMLFEEADLLLESDINNFAGGLLSPLEKLHRLGRELGLMSITSVSGI